MLYCYRQNVSCEPSGSCGSAFCVMEKKNKGGRPLKEIDKEQFENLCSLQCTKAEMCEWFKVTDKTLEAWCKRTYEAGFSDVFEQKRSKGKISLRRMQWRLAERNTAMAIFLGKQYLGQSDNVSVGVDLKMEDDPITKALKESGLTDGLEQEAAADIEVPV